VDVTPLGSHGPCRSERLVVWTEEDVEDAHAAELLHRNLSRHNLWQTEGIRR
jgi:hypothetical protein